MHANFWHSKWEKGEIAFHQADANPLLVAHFSALPLPENSRIFIPLCGKTRDLAWLLEKGYAVVGAELSTLAIEQLFADLGVTPELSRVGELMHYCAPDLDIFVGDIFKLSGEQLGAVDAVYDRAALVALPAEMRELYSRHLIEITRRAPQLLISYEYDQGAVAGPPFSVSAEEVQRHYGASHALSLIASTPVAGGMKGKCDAVEHVWLLGKV